MLRILSVLSLAALLAICSGCAPSEPPLPASTFPHDPSILAGKPFGDPPDFTNFLDKQRARQALLMQDLKRTRSLTTLDESEQAAMMLSPLKLRRMELNNMLRNLDDVHQWSAEQRTQVRNMINTESEWVNESIRAIQPLKQPQTKR